MHLLDLIRSGEVRAEERRFKRGQVLWLRGDPNEEGLFLLVEGMLEISHYTPDGRKYVINLLRPVALLGEISLLTGRPHSLTVEGYEDGRLLLVRRDDLFKLLREHPELWREVALSSLDRLWNLTERYLMLVALDAKARVLNLLVNLARSEGTDTLRLTHEEIAQMCAVTRETASRALKSLEREGYLRLERGRVQLLRLP